MTAPLLFPNLPGTGWPVTRRMLTSTKRGEHISGRVTRRPLFSVPKVEFELTINALDSDGAWPGAAIQSLQALTGLYLACQQSGNTFLYTDPIDNFSASQALGTGDGTTTAFAAQRAIGAFAGPVSWLVQATKVSIAAAVTNAWTLQAPNQILFATAPAAGALVTADLLYAWNCEFMDDTLDTVNFMQGLHEIKSLKFRSVK